MKNNYEDEELENETLIVCDYCNY
jgi:hypothetical protein